MVKVLHRIKNHISKFDIIEMILCTSGLVARTGWYYGFKPYEFNDEHLYSIFIKLRRLDPRYAIEFVKMVLNMKVLSANDFIKALYNLAKADFVHTDSRDDVYDFSKGIEDFVSDFYDFSIKEFKEAGLINPTWNFYRDYEYQFLEYYMGYLSKEALDDNEDYEIIYDGAKEQQLLRDKIIKHHQKTSNIFQISLSDRDYIQSVIDDLDSKFPNRNVFYSYLMKYRFLAYISQSLKEIVENYGQYSSGETK